MATIKKPIGRIEKVQGNHVPAKRLEVLKTYKIYIGGQFPRTESGRYYVAVNSKGENLANLCLGSRKDFRDAVVAARNAFEGWAKKSAYLRGQILYRAAEMLESRAPELANEDRLSWLAGLDWGGHC